MRFTSHLSDSSLLDILFIIMPWRNSEAVQRQKPHQGDIASAISSLRFRVSNKWHVWEVTIDTAHVDSGSSKYIAIACNRVTRARDDSSMLPSRDVRSEAFVCRMTFPIG